jgi:hypothetical protein
METRPSRTKTPSRRLLEVRNELGDNTTTFSSIAARSTSIDRLRINNSRNDARRSFSSAPARVNAAKKPARLILGPPKGQPKRLKLTYTSSRSTPAAATPVGSLSGGDSSHDEEEDSIRPSIEAEEAQEEEDNAVFTPRGQYFGVGDLARAALLQTNQIKPWQLSDDDESLTEVLGSPGPSAQREVVSKKTSKKRKTTESPNDVSPTPEYDENACPIEISMDTHIGKALQYSADIAAAYWSQINNFMTSARLQIANKYSRNDEELIPDHFGVRLTIKRKGKVLKTINCSTEEQYESFKKIWWDKTATNKPFDHRFLEVSGKAVFEWKAPAPVPTPVERVVEAPTRRSGGGVTTRMSASQRQRVSNANEAMVEEVLADSLTTITAKWVCRVASCPNKGALCAGNLHGHLALSLPNIKKWNALIKKGVANTDEVPGEVLGDAKVARDRHKLQDKGQGMPLPVMPAPIYCQYYYAGGVGGSGESGMPGGFPPQNGPLTASVGTAIAPPKEPQSSPPFLAGDDDENLLLYLSWLAVKYPRNREEFASFGDILAGDGWSFSAIREITDLQFEAMKIAPGFVRKIKKHLKEWVREGHAVENGSGGAVSS